MSYKYNVEKENKRQILHIIFSQILKTTKCIRRLLQHHIHPLALHLAMEGLLQQWVLPQSELVHCQEADIPLLAC